MGIKSGVSIKIIMNPGQGKEAVGARDSLVYDIIGKKLIIAQTKPPVLDREVNKTIRLTYLTSREKKDPARYGFDATITGLIEGYKMVTGYTTQAVVLLRKTDPVEYNLRFSFRVELPSKSGLEIVVSEQPLEILDISVGGVKIMHTRQITFTPGELIKVRLSIDGSRFEEEAVVVRTWGPPEERMAQSIEFVALQFASPSMQFEKVLGRKIVDIQRELLSKKIR
jgi:hypothetical protein